MVSKHQSTAQLHHYRPCLITTTHIFIFIIFISMISLSFSDSRINQSGLFCGNSSSSPSLIVPTFVKVMETLSQLITSNNTHFATFSFNSSMFSLSQCHSDLSHTDCLLCFAASRTKLPRCLPSLSGRIFLDGCFLRYDRYSFYHESLDPSLDAASCSRDDDLDPGFRERVGGVVGNAVKRAVEKGGFGVAGGGGVYGLAQCWESVNGCGECLEKAKREVMKCVPKREGRGMNAGCYLRYSTHKFFSNDDGDVDDDHHVHGFSGLGATIAIVLATAAFLVLSFFAAYAVYLRLTKTKYASKNLGKISISFSESSLHIGYETLEKATDYFNPSRKLGQGGTGSVYMGTLPNGHTVAVKRLVFNTRQWVDEFYNEVNLVSGIQHKNLVKLLGCSIEGPESLLVYEYVPNRSLDHFLFDKNRMKTLNWKQRFDVIVGVAEGLAYLHGGSPVRIIHRDIKSSNVLLDENLTPKIADFGLVRCFGADKSHLSTGIAGTIGYMAPEYLIRGKLTEKADVYSYGVVVLEIVTGKRCNAFMEDSPSLLHKVWQLYKSNALAEAMDPSMSEEIEAKEATFVLHIGLLCTQASAALRPSMGQVVSMLSDFEGVVPMPRQPPFMNNASMLHCESSLRSFSSTSNNSFVSNAATAIAPSCTSSFESSSLLSSDRPLPRSEELVRSVYPN